MVYSSSLTSSNQEKPKNEGKCFNRIWGYGKNNNVKSLLIWNTDIISFPEIIIRVTNSILSK